MAELVKVNKDGGTAEVLLSRPEAFNAFNLEMIELLANHLIGLATDDAVGALIISGEGKAFCAGGDLKWALGSPDGPPTGFHAWISYLPFNAA